MKIRLWKLRRWIARNLNLYGKEEYLFESERTFKSALEIYKSIKDGMKKFNIKTEDVGKIIIEPNCIMFEVYYCLNEE